MRHLITTTLSIALLASSTAMAASDVAPLSPGQAAGVRQAQSEGHTLLFVLGAGALAAGIALAATSGNGGGPSSINTNSLVSTTTTTG
jgi:hypothetical protein